MTKGEMRKARKLARATGQPLTPDAVGAELAVYQAPVKRPRYTRARRRADAMYTWAHNYDALNGAPEGTNDR